VVVVRCAFVGDESLVERCVGIAPQRGLDVVLIATTSRMVRQYAADFGIAVVARGAEKAALDENPSLRRAAEAELAVVSTHGDRR
jgi:hypothetical protein